MDFHSLLRRDLQFLCKRNKIPANMTNLAMADALKSLEIVEGLDEYMNQNDSNVLQSPTSVAKLPPSTATRTTRKKTTAMKAVPELGSLSCRLTSKSLLHGEIDQENVTEDESKTSNVKFEAKTPAARKASCSRKVQESKKGELVQSAYSTRRSTRLLEKCMADLSLITKKTEQKVSAKEKNPDGSEEAEVIPGRDLCASMEKEWGMLVSDSDQVIGGLEISVENTETMEVMSDEKESENSLLQVDNEEENMQANEAVCEEGSNKNDNDQEIIDLENCVDLNEIPVLEHANTETSNDNKDSDVQAFESLEQDEHLEIEQAIQEPEKVNTFDEETVVHQADGDSETEPEEDDSCVDSDSISEADSNQVDHQETEQAIQENDSETVKINTLDEATIMVDQTEPEEDDSGDGTISEADSNQAVQGSDSETVKINTFDEATTTVDQTEPEEDDYGDGTISEADSNEAVQGSDIAEEEMMILSESEGSVTAPTSPSLLVEEAKVKTAPFAAESISAQFPRPNNSAAATTPSKNSAMKLVSVDNNNNKENNMGMMVVNVVNNGEIKVEEAKKKYKKVEFDEENLKDVSIRKLVKMVKDLSIKGSNNNRTALQMLPGNNQTAE